MIAADTEAVAVGIQAFAAIAAAVGAGAAWRAASASRATSRDALEALAVGIRPNVEASFHPMRRWEWGDPPPTRLWASVRNSSEWPAKDITLKVQLRDGRSVADGTEHLDAAGGRPQVHELWEVELTGDMPEPIEVERELEQAVLRYSDERRIDRYEITYTFVYEQTQSGSVTSTGTQVEIDERRI